MHMRRLLLAAAVLLPFASPALAVTASTCAPFATINQGEYIVQQNEWNSSLTQCISSTGNNFTVTTANFNMPNGAPADYPSIYKGCHWGNCTPSSSSGMPVQVSSATASTSVSITTNSSYNYDSSYDIWFNTTPTTSGQPNGTEMMIWVSHAGFPQPVGSKQATVTIDGSSWDVWVGNSGWIVISYVKTSPANSASLDLKPFFQDAVSRGALQNSWYLIAIEYGFEIWTGGQGMAVNSFSATVGSGGGGTTYALSVSTSGSGMVTSNPSGINCGSTCSATYNSGTTVTLTAAPASGSTFGGWGGACTGTGTTCTVSMTAARSVTATFNGGGGGTTYALSVTKSGSGSGTVTSSSGGINCGSTCSATYASGTTVTLTATAASGSTFGGWSNGCTGTSSTCTVSMTAARTVTATFNGSGGGGGTCTAVSGGQSGNFNTTGAICFTVSGTINGWGCSNVDGRTVSVNGTATTCGKMPLPGSSPYTFSFTAGSYPWASFYWW
jgi:hypothetical protein